MIENSKRLNKTDNLQALIYKFGQMGLKQVKYFVPPFTRAGEDPVPCNDEQAKKLVDALKTHRTIRLESDVVYPRLTQKSNQVHYDQGMIDSIWAILNYLKTNNPEKEPWEYAGSILVEREGSIRFRFVLDAKTIVNVVPVENEEQMLALKIENDRFSANPDDYSIFLVVVRDKNLLKHYIDMRLTLPVTFCILDGSPLDEPTSVKYMTKKK